MMADGDSADVGHQCSSIEQTFQVIDGMLVGCDSGAELRRYVKDLCAQFSRIHQGLADL
jgi:hypothetical protein